MSVIATVRLPTAEFALRETFDAHPEIDCEIVRVAAHGDSHVMPLIWVLMNDADPDAVHDTMAIDPSVDEYSMLNDLGDERLYLLNWVADVQLIIHAIVDERSTILDAQTEGAEWVFRVLFPERDSISRTTEFAEDRNLTLAVESIYELDEERKGVYGLSSDQYEALLAAYELGYFSVPRRITMTELADELGVSQQALSERLRRGHQNLVGNTLAIGGLEDSDGGE